MASITSLVLTACSQKKLSFSESEITVQGDTIYYSGKPFAKLSTIDADAILLGKDALFSSQTVSGFGLAIHYYDSDKDVWIHPRKGLSIYFDGHTYNKVNEMQQVWEKSRKQIRTARGFPLRLAGQYMDKEDVIRIGVYDVKISNDGKYVRYKSQGMLWNSSHKYRIEYERSE